MQVKEYNRMEMMEYDKKCNELAEEWRQGNCSFPQQSLYGFYYNGNFRQTGYVAFDGRRAILRKTKKQAIQDFNKMI